MQNKNNIKNWKIEITNEGAKLFITEGAVMARDVLNLAREQAIKYNLSVLKIYMHDGQYYDYTFEDDMLYFIHMTEKIENEDISYLMKRAAEKLSTLKLDDRIWSVNFSIDNLPREKNGDLYAACAMVIHFYDRNDDYEIDSQRFYFNLSSGQWESIKNVKNKSISCKWKYQIQRYTELFKNVYGPEIENPKDGMEKEREVIKTLIKEGLGMLNKVRSQALFLDDIEMQEDITNALNIFLAAEEKQQKISPEKNLFEDYTDEELLIFYDCLKKADFYVIPELSKIASKYVSSKRCYLDLIFELSKRWYQEKQKKYKEENGKFHQWLEGEDPLI